MAVQRILGSAQTLDQSDQSLPCLTQRKRGFIVIH